MSKNSWIGRVSRGEWCAGGGVLGLTIAIGSAIWRHIPMGWPLAPGAWFVVGASVIAIGLVGYAYVTMRTVEPPLVQPQRGTDGIGWRWSSSPTSAANTASAAKIGFRVTVVETVARKATVPAPPAARAEGGSRRLVTSAPSSTEPDAWTEHLVAGNVDFDDDVESPDEVAPVVPTAAVEAITSSTKSSLRKATAESPVAKPGGARHHVIAGTERAGAPPLQRRARREAMAAGADPAAKVKKIEASDGLDDLAQRLLKGVAAPHRRRADAAESSVPEPQADAGPRRIARDAPGVFACPEATRD